MLLSDRQTLVLPEFRDFPSTSLTLEAWVWSVDVCRQGALFSYSTGTGAYGVNDNRWVNWDLGQMHAPNPLAFHVKCVSVSSPIR